MSTRILAAGGTISRRRMMVAPSLEMVVPPLSSWMSLSMPQGPSVVRTVSATAVQALMLLTTCAFPCDVSVPSLSRMICGCIMEAMVGSLGLAAVWGFEAGRSEAAEAEVTRRRGGEGFSRLLCLIGNAGGAGREF
uniref:Uncharacterized protein n=1 Tax=Arundo donax TaxID=35708 RepID=A0A0A9AA80_ARUDO